MLRRLTAQSTWLLLGRLISQLGLALCTILLARQLGQQAFGEYAFIASVIVVGNVLTTFGTDMHLIREIAASGDDQHLTPALWLQLGLSLIFILLATVLSVVVPGLSSAGRVAMRIYAVALIPLAFFTVYTTALRGRQRMTAYSLLNIALVALQLIAVILVIRLRGGLVFLSFALLAVQLLAALIAAGLARVRLSLSPLSAGTQRQVSHLVRASASIALLSIVGVGYQRLSLLLLPSIAGSAATGLFSAAGRVVEAAKVGHVAAFTALYPMMAQFRASPADIFKRHFRLALLGLMLLAVLVAFALHFFATQLVTLLYGFEYAPSASLLALLAWILIPYSLNGFLSLALLARGIVRPILQASIAAMFALGILTYSLVPGMGLAGAAVAALCAEVIESIFLTAQYAGWMRPESVATPSPYSLSTEA